MEVKRFWMKNEGLAKVSNLCLQGMEISWFFFCMRDDGGARTRMCQGLALLWSMQVHVLRG